MAIQLQLETTSTCNAACVFCPYPTANRHGGLMKDDLFRKIMDEAATIPYIIHVTLTGLGEPTLDPHIVQRVALARQRKPGAHIDLYTNGVYMTPVLVDRLVDAGITGIVFSLNAVDPQQHESQMRLAGKYDKVCANIEHAIKQKLKVEVRCVVAPNDFTPEQVVKFRERWGSHGVLISEGNWAGQNRTVRGFEPNECCHRAVRQIYVLWDGKVTPCCFMPTDAKTFGDLSKQTLREVYSSPEYLKFREDHCSDNADRYAFCATCTRI